MSEELHDTLDAVIKCVNYIKADLLINACFLVGAMRWAPITLDFDTAVRSTLAIKRSNSKENC